MKFDYTKYLSEMSNYELFDAYFIVRNALVSDVTIFMTILFAFLTVAYFVSAKLNKFQAITISTLYSVFALYMISSAFNSSQLMSQIASAVTGMEKSPDSVVLVTILLVSWIFSLILFWQARRRGRAESLSP